MTDGDEERDPWRPPSQEGDIELGSVSPQCEPSRGREISAYAGGSRGDQDKNSPSPGAEISRQRSHPCLGIATLLCIIIGIVLFAAPANAFEDSFRWSKVPRITSINAWQDAIKLRVRAWPWRMEQATKIFTPLCQLLPPQQMIPSSTSRTRCHVHAYTCIQARPKISEMDKDVLCLDSWRSEPAARYL